MKDIYIVLSNTGSVPSRIIELATKSKYTHSSISLDSSLENMYSFGRKYINFPWYGTFVRENINEGLYKRNKNSKIKVIKLSITEDSFNKLSSLIEDFKYSEGYHYDLLAAVGMYFGKDMFSDGGYVCSSFVFHCLNEIGIYIDGKTRSNIMPEDFNYIDDYEVEYEGYANMYNRNIKLNTQEYI